MGIDGGSAFDDARVFMFDVVKTWGRWTPRLNSQGDRHGWTRGVEPEVRKVQEEARGAGGTDRDGPWRACEGVKGA